MSLKVYSPLLRSAVSLARNLRYTPSCSMYENPYLKKFREESQPSPDFYKQSTNLTGLFVNERPHHALKVLYGRLLRELSQLPAESQYRVNTEEIVKHRMALVESEPDMEKLAALIGMGQLEEVIQQADYELETVRYMSKYKVWEPLVEEPEEAQWRWPIH